MTSTVTPYTNGTTLLSAHNLVKHFAVGRQSFRGAKNYLRAVDGVSFNIQPKETFSLVGESGCGKTTTARMVLRLENPTSGEVLWNGENVHNLKGARLGQYRASVQAVFQDPLSSLNPRMRVRDIIGEPLAVNQRLTKREIAERAGNLMEAVGLHSGLMGNFPHEFSGGMRQRIAVARALALQPALIVLDEPVSALDVSIRAQIMNLLKDLQDRFNLAYLLIAHDLATVRYLSHNVAVMYLGEIVEYAPSEDLFTNPLHPYTRALIDAATPTRPGEERQELILSEDMPSPISPPEGCRFHTRCPFAFGRCSKEKPTLQALAPKHKVACHLYDSGAATTLEEAVARTAVQEPMPARARSE